MSLFECSHANECQYKGTIACLVCYGKVRDNKEAMKGQQEDREPTTEELLKEVKIQIRQLKAQQFELEMKLKKEKKQKKRARMI